MKRSITKAFTLIELLIVVLIIAILAAIAVPNFLEFQTRAKVSRAKADLRNIAVGLEAYYVDNDEFPPSAWFVNDGAANYPNGFYASRAGVTLLTTPISYFSTYPADPFPAF